MKREVDSEAVQRRIGAALFPALALVCAAWGWWSWRCVPSESRVAELRARAAAALARSQAARAHEPRVEMSDDIEARLPSTLEFADFLARIEASAAKAGIAELRVDSAEALDRAPLPELRSYGGRLSFESSWGQVVVFLSEIERGVPAMRVRSLSAEPRQSTIRVDCVLDAWAYAAAPEGKE